MELHTADKIRFFVWNVSSFLSTLCCIALLMTWCVIPRWRTLQNYITVNQILAGTLAIVCNTIFVAVANDITYPLSFHLNLIMFMLPYIDLLVMCWSLCASLNAYIKLVLRATRKYSYEKRVYTLFAYMTACLLFGIQWIHFLVLPAQYTCNSIIYLLPALSVWSISFIFYMSIVMSIIPCGGRRISQRKGSHVLSLVGVATMCDSLKIVIVIKELLVEIFLYSKIEDPRRREVIYLLDVGTAIYSFRWVFQTLFVLCNRSSRRHWKMYVRKRRNRNVNNNELR